MQLSLAAVTGVALAGGVVRGFAGFGSAIMLVAGFSLVLGPVRGVALVALVEIPGLLLLLPGVRKQVDGRLAGLLALTALPVLPLGVVLLTTLDRSLMPRIVGGGIVALVLLMGTGWRPKLRPRPPLTALVGALSGALKGAVGMGGPPVVLYLLADAEADHARLRATMLFYFTILAVWSVGAFTVAGALDGPLLQIAALPVLSYLAGTRVGAALFGRVSKVLFERVVLAALLAAGLAALLK